MPRTTVSALLTLALSASIAYTAAPAAAAPAEAAEARTPYLTRPTGSHPVGTTSLYLKDTSRPDPWVPSVKARELMVSLWYPARSAGERRAPYMTAKVSELMLKGGGITGVPYDILSRTRTNASTDAKPAGRPHSLPLVVLSPGFTNPRATLTGLAEDLASHGYVVAAIDHTYEGPVQFPGGRVTTCAACDGERSPAFWEKLARGRAKDVSFVLDRLTGAHAKWTGAALIDPSRIGMAGHSVGGASALAAMRADRRVRAGIDMDGTTVVPAAARGLARPFLFLGSREGHSPGKDHTWDRDWKRLTGWKRWLVVDGAQHASFTDITLLADEVGVESGAEMSGARSLEITRRYVRAFFDQHLRKRHQPLLAKPSKRYPEVRFCVPGKQTCS
jgi:predicted dienelactone hydrolase